MDVFIFTAVTRQNRLVLAPDVPYGFEDPDFCPYAKTMGWGDYAPSGTDPVIVVTKEEIDVHPCVIFAEDHASGRKKHQFVMPDRAAAHLGISLEEAESHVWDGQTGYPVDPVQAEEGE